MKRVLLTCILSILSHALLAQTCPTGATCITIPAQQVSVTWNGKALKVNIPAQTVPLPTAALPAGITFTPASGTTPAVLAVAGNVSAASISLTNGPALPNSTNGLYLLQLQPTGFLTPTPYVPVALPAFSISQADPTVNAFTTP